MTGQPERGADDDRHVACWLQSNPDFFVRHPGVAETLAIPHPAGHGLSLLQYQNRLLKQRQCDADARQAELLAIARQLTDRAERLHRFCLELLQATDLDTLLDAILLGLHVHLEVDGVGLRVPAAGEGPDRPERCAEDDPGLHLLAALAPDWVPKRLTLSPVQSLALFPERPEAVTSAVLIPLVVGSRTGLLALVTACRLDRTLFRRVGECCSQALTRYA